MAKPFIEPSCHGALHFITVIAPTTAKARPHTVCKRTDPIAARCHTASETRQSLPQPSARPLPSPLAVVDEQQTMHRQLFHTNHFTRAGREKGTRLAHTSSRAADMGPRQ